MFKSISSASRRPARLRLQGGASLIEVLVAILLVALGVLAMASMQVNAMRMAKTNEFRAMGALLAADLADRMRANRAAVFLRSTPGGPASNQYLFTEKYPANGDATVGGSAPECDKTSVSCTEADMAAFDLLAWRRAVAASLPGGWARIAEVDGTNNAVDLWLMWTDVQNTPLTGEEQACPTDAVDAASKAAPRCMYFRVNL